MKRKLLIIGGLVGLFVLFVLLRFFIFDKPSETGRIKILSSPTAGVFIDNAPVGKTPFESRVVPGEHTIKLIPEGEDSQSVSWEGTVTVYANTLTFISRELGTSDLTSAGEVLTVTKMSEKSSGQNGEVSVITEPAGAIIFLDNDEKGIAPLVLKDVPAGEHELAVYLPGFFRRSQKISVTKGHVVDARFKLALDKTHKTLDDALSERIQDATSEAELDEASEGSAETESAVQEATTLTIQDTPTGFLNVRDEPSTAGAQVARVAPGDEFTFTDERNGWYKITLEDGDEGWVSGDYIEEN